MNAQALKERIVQDNLIEHILTELGCQHIRLRGDWWRATRPPDGDNKNSVQVNKETLQTKIWTRGISGDIITLVEYVKELYFLHAIKWICDVCKYDYYHLKPKENDVPSLLKWLDTVENIDTKISNDKVQPIPETVLNQYIYLPHEQLINEDISIQALKEFEVGFDFQSERITIPIRDELGTLVGVKGRSTVNTKGQYKYIYLYPTSKTKILYGLYKTLPYIKKQNEVIVVEGEKTVQKLWGWGYKNVVAIGSKDISEIQIEKLLKLNAQVTIALDKDVSNEHLKKIVNHFKLFTKVNVIYDKWNLLKEKDSPTDQGKKVFEQLYKNKFPINS